MTSDLPVAAGSLIAGKYRVERLLGDGGMGVVVAAVHEKLGERRAIKMMRPALALNPESTRRFLREAQAAARLRSEHVARVYDVDEIDGVPIMIMEYLEGADLAAVLADSGRSRCPRPRSTCARPARAWPRPTRRGWCTATSSPPTCS
jgi:serine/threonine-protein kinase